MTRLPLRVESHASVAELVGRPGTIMLFDPSEFAVERREANICCPGCGEVVLYNDGVEYEMVGPKDTLSIPRELLFRCCGWKGRLREGYWIGRVVVSGS